MRADLQEANMIQLNWPEAIVIVAFLIFALGVMGIFTAGRKSGTR